MKNLDLNNYGVQEMDAKSMSEVDGGFLPLLIVGALLLSSCTIQVTVGDNNDVKGSTSADSTGNGNTVGHGNRR